MKFSRFLSIVKKEFIHVKRDPASLIMAFFMPVIFSLLFGYAVITDVDNINMVVLDLDKSYESRQLIAKYGASNYFEIDGYVNDINQIERGIDGGEYKSALIIPTDFSKKVVRGEKTNIQLIIDGSDPTIARTALQSGVLIGNSYFGDINLNEIIGVNTKVWYNSNLESTKFTIPGLIGLIMQNITIMLTAFSLVREKEKGTIEQLMVTPIKPSELILGKMIPYILIGSADFLIALFFGTFWFKVPIEGNLVLLIVLGFGFVICALAIGMLISSVSSNQLQAMQMAILVLLPSVILSGFVFPREAMPLPIRLIGNVIPLTYFLNILRGIILKGNDIALIWKDVFVLLFMGITLLFMATKKFRKTLD